MIPFLIALAVLAVLSGLFCLLCLKKCPADKILVVCGSHLGRDAKGNARSVVCQHGGCRFVLPLVQRCEYLDLTPVNLRLEITDPWRFEAGLSVAVSPQPGIMERAALCLIGLSPNRIGEMAESVALGQLRLAAELWPEPPEDRDCFCASYCAALEPELNKLGLTVVNFRALTFGS